MFQYRQVLQKAEMSNTSLMGMTRRTLANALSNKKSDQHMSWETGEFSQ